MKNLWWLAWLGVSSLATFAEEKPGFIPSPLTMSDEIPGHPWDGKGAGEFKGPLAAALKELLGAGFPDPAGLPYHKIEIPTGSCWVGDTGVIQTEGWLLPAEKDGAAYAIAWNGLVYPVVLRASISARSRELCRSRLAMDRRWLSIHVPQIANARTGGRKSMGFMRCGHSEGDPQP